MSKKAVFGVITKPHVLEMVVMELERHGFGARDVSVLTLERHAVRRVAVPTPLPTANDFDAVTAPHSLLPAPPPPGANGAGAHQVTHFGGLTTTGPLQAAVGSDGIDGLAAVLVGVGMPRFAAKRYETRLRDGATLIAVHAEAGAEVDSVKDLLRKLEVLDIGTVFDGRMARQPLPTPPPTPMVPAPTPSRPGPRS